MKKFVATIIAIMLLFPVIATAQKSKGKGKTSTAPAVNLEEVLSNARKALADYRFDDAMHLMNTYRNALKGAEASPEAEDIEHSASMGAEMLERVEDLVIVDSVIVDKARFFEAYMLSPQAGRLLPSQEGGNSPIYLTQNGLTEFYAMADDDGTYSIVSARVLADGSTEDARIYPTADGIDDAAYPFLMPDGMTLYFAGTGPESLGGYDIFITRRNAVDDEFLQPQNLGMPFNSPYDDYMLAIDETTGIGWWATDRRQLPGKLTVYMFIPSELRKNLEPDSGVDIASRAFISSIADSQPSGFVKPDIQMSVKNGTGVAIMPEFEFALPGGRVITSLSELKSGRSRELMQDYLDAMTKLEGMRTRLSALRMEYGAGTISAATEILDLESRIEVASAELQRLANEVVKSEN